MSDTKTLFGGWGLEGWSMGTFLRALVSPSGLARGLAHLQHLHRHHPSVSPTPGVAVRTGNSQPQSSRLAGSGVLFTLVPAHSRHLWWPWAACSEPVDQVSCLCPGGGCPPLRPLPHPPALPEVVLTPCHEHESAMLANSDSSPRPGLWKRETAALRLGLITGDI